MTVKITHSEQETRQIAQSFAKNLKAGTVVLLFGDLGTGKTVFVRGIGEALGISNVRSPSFTLINEYQSSSGLLIVHADLYRLESVDGLGLEEYTGAFDTVLFVEWPERWENPPVNAIKVSFSAISINEREIIIEDEL